MKKYLIPFLNWRILVLNAIAMLAFLLLAGDTDDIIVFLFIKVLGFGCGYACYRLVERWDKLGLINELNVYSEKN